MQQMKIVKVFQTEVICYIHCQNRIILFIFLLVNVTVSRGILGTLKVICIFSESGILCQTRSIHQIEKIAVVGTKIQQGQSFRYTVGLQEQKVITMRTNLLNWRNLGGFQLVRTQCLTPFWWYSSNQITTSQIRTW